MVMAGSTPHDLNALQGAVWDLDEFVETVNALLPVYLPKEAAGRASEEVNARLVRHYATLGLISEARKEGREARYMYPHLVQTLTVRKLLAEGFTTAAAKQVLEGRAPDELQRLLEGTMRIDLVPEPTQNETSGRLDFLRSVRQRAGLEHSPAPASPSPPTATPANPPNASLFDESHWTRLSILDGLDLFVRDDFKIPKNRLGDAQLTQLLKVVLVQLEQRRKGST